MNLADSMKKSVDDFKILLNWRGKHTFTMEPCVYGGERKVVYDVVFGKMDFYIVADAETPRDDVFGSFDRFVENMLKYTSAENNPYTAVLLHDSPVPKPILTIDVSNSYGTKEMLLIFGEFGETAALGYDDVDLRKRLKEAFAAKIDLKNVRKGVESAIVTVFGRPDMAEVLPPEEKKLGNSDDGGGGGDGGSVGDTGAGGGAGAADGDIPTTAGKMADEAS